MKGQANITVLIPALNEEEAIGKVIDAVPAWVDRIVVTDNGSTDRTAQIAAEHGAVVVAEPRLGYGSACLAAMSEVERLEADEAKQIIVFLDGDGADNPAEMDKLVDPIAEGNFDMVVGSRLSGELERGALTLTQRLGNTLCCYLIRAFFGVRYSDLGPFRAIDWAALKRIKMDAVAYGWTVQMQVRAARVRLKTTEVPVSYRRRNTGKSKISGTVRGNIGAGATILFVIFAEATNVLFKKSFHFLRSSAKGL